MEEKWQRLDVLLHTECEVDVDTLHRLQLCICLHCVINDKAGYTFRSVRGSKTEKECLLSRFLSKWHQIASRNL